MQDGNANPKMPILTVWKKNIPFTCAKFETSQFVSDTPNKNLPVYALEHYVNLFQNPQ